MPDGDGYDIFTYIVDPGVIGTAGAGSISRLYFTIGQGGDVINPTQTTNSEPSVTGDVPNKPTSSTGLASTV